MLTWFLLAKILVSAAMVLSLSAVAEYGNPRLAGILSGAPMGAPIVLLFVGHEQGIDFAVSTVPTGIAGFAATLAFTFAYDRAATLRKVGNAPIATLLATIAFFAVGWGVVQLGFGLGGSIGLIVAAIIASSFLLPAMDGKVKVARIRMSFRVLILRAALSAAFVVSIISAAELVGPDWSGVLLGFPMTILPMLLILHLTYGAEHARNAIRGFPIGLGGVLLYLVTVPLSFPAFGIIGGTVVAVAVGVGYLAALNAVRWHMAARRASSA